MSRVHPWGVRGHPWQETGPPTPAEDCDIKFPDYQRLPWAQEIVLVSSDRRLNRVWRRAGARWELEVVEGDGVLAIESLGIVLSLAAFYDGTGIT